MDKNETQTLTELLFLESDGELTAAEASKLDAAIAGSSEMQEARRQLARLDTLLSEARIEVEPDFKSELMANLPPAGWSARHPRTWWLAAAVLALLGGGAALLTGLSAAQLEPASPFLTAMMAVGDMLTSSLAAGAGLIGASWRGIGLAMGEWLGASVPNAIAFAVLLVGVNLLLVRRLRRRLRNVDAEASTRSRPSDVE